MAGTKFSGGLTLLFRPLSPLSCSWGWGSRGASRVAGHSSASIISHILATGLRSRGMTWTITGRGVMKEWLEAFDRGGIIAWIVCAAVLFPTLMKGLFALHQQRSRSRKELLELWKDRNLNDDFWLETLIRHNYGASLPAALINYLVEFRLPSSRLARLASNWPWFEYDAPNQLVCWKGARKHKIFRSAERIACATVYFVLGMCGFILVTTKLNEPQIMWVGLFMVAVAVISLFHVFSLSEAERLFRSVEFSDLCKQ